MKLKKLERTRSVSLKPRITVGKTGIFYLNREAILLIIKDKDLDKVDIFQDTEGINKFFLKVSKNGTCKITNKKIHKGRPLSVTFIFAVAARHMNRCFKHVPGTKPLRFTVGELVVINKEHYFPLYIVKHSIVTEKETNNIPYTFQKVEQRKNIHSSIKT